MASLKNVNPDLRNYLRKHKIPEIYEAILTGLAITNPEDPYEFIMRNIGEFLTTKVQSTHGLEALTWDSLIPEEFKPQARTFTAVYLDSIFSFDEAHLMPSPEQYQKAYQYYNNKLIDITFGAWLFYHQYKKHKRAEMARKLKLAAEHYDLRKQRVHFTYWLSWVRFARNRLEIAHDIIRGVYQMSLSRLVFEAWHNVMLDAKRTREYFERLERGELDGEEEIISPRGEARDDISLLPRKVAIKIFGYLDLADRSHCAQVCRSWKMIVSTPYLWSKVNLSAIKVKTTDKLACKLLQKCRPYLLHLNLRACVKLTKPAYYAVGQCRNLQDLNLSECVGVNDDVMRDILEGCSILLYLNISFTNITDATLRLLAKSCKNLQYLSLAYCRRFSDRGLQYLAMGRGCRKLIYIDLSGAAQITSVGYKNIASGCSNLEHLVVNNCATLRDDCILMLTAKCRNIRSVSFLQTPNITDLSLKALAQHRKLQQIKIEGNNRISDNSFKYVGKMCSEIRHLYITDCPRITDASLKSLAPCRNINVLNFADCIRITDAGVRNLVEGPSGPKLREINLSNCVRVTDVSIMKITQKCYNLVYGKFCFSEHITDAGAEMLGNMPVLASVDISGCNITDTGLGALGNNVSLRDTTLAECFQITDLGVQKFAQQCRDLERLDISHCTELTDVAIKNLAFCCRRLTVLSLAGCSKLTDLSIRYLSGVCHNLLSLDISGCPKIRDDSMRFLRKGCKRLKKLKMLYCTGITKETFQKLGSKIPLVLWNDDPIPNTFGPGPEYLQLIAQSNMFVDFENDTDKDQTQTDGEVRNDNDESKGKKDVPDKPDEVQRKETNPDVNTNEDTDR
ncbi:F-box and leucine-rich repeat protein 13-like isoform X2 [Apostichopus japonicus]|uniref:F-box and leucine-rich repeat protein 13-like isoform X2 n=1 Tax=Stichopus japonicus TaxID=307972 RepID=UPI003AB2FFF0